MEIAKLFEKIEYFEDILFCTTLNFLYYSIKLYAQKQYSFYLM